MKKNTIILLAAMLVSQITMAALPEIKFKRIDTRDGLSNSMVSTIYKDSRGFVWFGTPYGLNRYDGFRVRTYLANGDEPNYIKYNSVERIQEDYQGRLWLAQDNHICVYNPDDGSFKYDVDQRVKDFGINTDGTEKIFIDSKKNFWIKTYSDGLYCYNPYNKKVFHLEKGNRFGQLPQDVRIAGFAEYGKSMILLLSSGEMMCINTEKWWVSWRNGYLCKHKLQPHIDLQGKVSIDNQGNIWVIVGSDACVYDYKSHKWYDSVPEWFRSMGFVNVPDEIIVWEIMGDGDYIWLCTDHLGLIVADIKEKKLVNYTNDKKDETSISDITLHTVHKANDGSVWIGTYKNGVNLCMLGKTGFVNIPVGDINTVAEAPNGILWLGTNDRGVIRYNPKTGETANFNKDNAKLSTNIIVCSLIDQRDGTQWFGTFEGGLLHLDNGRVIDIQRKSEKGLISDNIWSIVQDEDGSLWLGTLGGGVQRYNPDTKEFRTYNARTAGLASDYTSSMQKLPNGDILVGTSYFFSTIKRSNGAVKNLVISPDEQSKIANINSVTTQVLCDSRGLLWHATLAGVVIKEPKTGRLWRFDASNGLQGTTVCTLIEDKNHDVWAVTTHSVARIMVEAKDDTWHFALYNFNSRDGLQTGPFNERSACVLANGNVVVGGKDGLSIINPKQLTIDRHDEMPLLTGMLIGDKYMTVGEAYNGVVVADKSMPIEDKVEIPHGVGRFTILLATDRTAMDNRARFVYKVEGLSDSWLSTSDNNPEITLMGLSSGSYTLRVRMLNGNGSFGSKERVLKIVVNPPFYLSFPAYCIYIIIICALLMFGFYRQQKRMRLISLKAEEDNQTKIEQAKDKMYETMSDELRQPFEEVVSSLSVLMNDESDEHKYGAEYKIREQVKALILQVNGMMAKNSKSASLIEPKIKNVEIMSVDSKLVADATKYVEDNLSNEEISVEAMSEALNMSRVHLYKRLLSLTGSTPSEFIRDIRLQHAERLLCKSQLTVSEVGYKVGFSNPRAFAKYFKDKYGELPSQYKLDHEKLNE